MNYLDMLMGYGVGEDAGPASAPPDLMALLGGGDVPAAVAPVQPPAQALPARAPVDNSMVIPLMLMRAAAEVSARRAPGQSRTNQILTAVYNSGLAGMDLKGQNEARANQDRKLQLDEATTAQNLSTSQQAQAQSAELHPLKAQALRLGITEAERKNKVEQKNLEWADRLKQAQLEKDQATTEAQRASASAKVMAAEAALQRSQTLMQELGLKAARLDLDASRARAAMEDKQRTMPKRWESKETGASGWTWEDGGKMYQQQDGMDRITALKHLEKQIAYEKTMSEKFNVPFASPSPADIQKTLQQLTTARISVWDNGAWRPVDDRKVDANGTPQPTKPTAGGSTLDPGETMTQSKKDDLLKKVKQLKPGEGYEEDGWIWVADPSKPDGIRAKQRAAPQAGSSGQSTPSAPPDKPSRTYTGVNAEQRDKLQLELDRLEYTANNTKNLTTEQRAALAQRMGEIQRKIADLAK